MKGMELWLLNRGSGMVLITLLGITVALGTLATERLSFRWWPRFLTQSLHRNLSLLAVVLTFIHALSAVLDEFVNIRWWETLVPFLGEYRPVPLGLGAVSLDLMLAVVITSLFRHRLPLNFWRALHLLSYPIFAIAVIHGLGIGTDTVDPWGIAITAATCTLVVVAIALRLTNLAQNQPLS